MSGFDEQPRRCRADVSRPQNPYLHACSRWIDWPAGELAHCPVATAELYYGGKAEPFHRVDHLQAVRNIARTPFSRPRRTALFTFLNFLVGNSGLTGIIAATFL